MRLPARGTARRRGCIAAALAICFWCGAGPAAAKLPAGMPTDVPAAASDTPPTLSAPSNTAGPFPNTFTQTSGTGRLAGGASLWTDFIYDDYGAAGLAGLSLSSCDNSSDLAPRKGNYVYPPGPANNNGADVFRAGMGLSSAYSYWRVDWVTLADPSVPIAEWTFDTDSNAATGASAWPAQAGVSSPGIDQALVVSSRGAWLVNPTTGVRTDVVAGGGRLTIDPSSKSFIVAVPRSLLPVSGTWRVRLGAGLADTTRQSVAPPYVGNPSSSPSPSAERVYNITFRAVAQEPPIFTSGTTAAQIAAIQALLAGTPLGAVLGLDGLARGTTGNFWMESDQADTLAGGNVSAFSRLVDWSQLAARTTTPEPQPTGYSVRWYVSRLNLGFGQVVNDGNNGNFQPTLLERLQPYAVYVPTTYRPGKRASLTWILHSYEVSYNQYGLLDPQLIQQLCQSRSSICATTEGLGPSGWYYNGAETDFWQVWRSLAQAFSLDATRTVSTGYSMGGWASYKLVFEHPDDFAGALSLDGPVVCGIQGFPGANFPAYQDPACSKDGQSQPLIANARWVPYVIDHTYADELVPVTGVIAQAQTFDRLGQRYDLFIHTGGDHLAFAVEDRFGGAVAALGLPGLKTNPDTFGYSWYPSLKSALFGIGATGDYWLHDLRAGDTAFGVIASVQAHDAALPDPTVTDQRFGPSLVTQPLPGTETGLRWKLGTRPKPRKTMTLRLTDVVGLSLDAAAAKLKTGTITIFTDRGTRFEIKNLARGTQVLERGHRVAAANRHGVVSVNLHSGKTVLMLVAAAATHPAPPPRQRPAPAPSFTG